MVMCMDDEGGGSFSALFVGSEGRCRSAIHWSARRFVLGTSAQSRSVG